MVFWNSGNLPHIILLLERISKKLMNHLVESIFNILATVEKVK